MASRPEDMARAVRECLDSGEKVLILLELSPDLSEDEILSALRQALAIKGVHGASVAHRCTRRTRGF